METTVIMSMCLYIKQSGSHPLQEKWDYYKRNKISVSDEQLMGRINTLTDTMRVKGKSRNYFCTFIFQTLQKRLPTLNNERGI